MEVFLQCSSRGGPRVIELGLCSQNHSPKTNHEIQSLKPCLWVLGAISIISACIAMGGKWYRVEINPAKVGGCDITISWDLWRHRCTWVDGPCEIYASNCIWCSNADECFLGIPGFTERGGDGHAYKTVQAFVTMQFIFSVFAMCASAVEGPFAMGMHVMTAVCGIIAMATFIGIAKSYLPPSQNDYMYGYGFAWCIIGWICAVFCAVLARKDQAGRSSSDYSGSQKQTAEVEVQVNATPEDFRTPGGQQ
eukprot:g77873.t1